MNRRHLAALAVAATLAAGGCAVDTARPQAPGSGIASTPSATTASPSATQSSTPTPTPTPTSTATPSDEPVPSATVVVTTRAPEASTSATATSSQASSPAPAADIVLLSGAVDPLVRQVQARLRQLELFGQYDLTDTYGPATTRGVSRYQERSGVPATGNLDARTWASLQRETKAPSQDELRNRLPGPVVVGAQDAATITQLQHRLSQRGHYAGALDGVLGDATVAGVRVFQEAQQIPVTGEIDQRTLDRLVSTTREPTPNELRGEPAPIGGYSQELDARCLTGRVMCASMGQSRLSWVVDGKTLLTIEARYGSLTHPSRPGVFHVWLKDPNAVSTIFGERIPMPYAMFYDEDRGVHYSEYFRRDGWTGTSHGCANVRDYEAVKWLYSQVRLGDTVVVY